MKHATGTFEVKMTPEAQAPGSDHGLPTSRLGIAKTFSGDLTGTATGTMLAAGEPKPGLPAGYVAIDQVHGTLEGRTGGFLLLHRGTIDPAGKADLSVIISPGSGTGALAGIAGTFSIEMKRAGISTTSPTPCRTNPDLLNRHGPFTAAPVTPILMG